MKRVEACRENEKWRERRGKGRNRERGENIIWGAKLERYLVQIVEDLREGGSNERDVIYVLVLEKPWSKIKKLNEQKNIAE